MRGERDDRMASRSGRILAGAAALVLSAAIVALGVYVFAGELAPGGERGSMAVMVAWFAVAVAGAFLVQRRARWLRVPLAIGVIGTIVAIVATLGYTSLTDRVVDEDVAVAGPAPTTRTTQAERAEPAPVNVELASGAFRGLAHATEGTAAAIELAEGGRVLTLTGFETDNGPDLFVYLVAGEVDGNGEGSGFVDLGGLKGNIGDQQYSIPEDVDLARYSSVVIWCRAFSAGFGVAELSRA